MNKKYKIVISIFTFLLGCGVSTMAAAYSKASSLESILKSQGYHRTHITINGFLYVKAFINKRPARAIIDTGSSDINVTKGSVRALKLTEFHSGENTSVDMHGRKSFTEAVILPHVVISNIPLGNVSASVLQHVSSGSVMTIAVGRNFLKQHHAIIDVYNKNLYLSNKKLSRLTMNKIPSVSRCS
ncbi:aspartyl protease family protein [Candidiatus Paracoxiella cheracis]|uniref:aspartyl protease family protein n=1 Tax=Candidiatus Paracoxiella cheracis TaxID=3405120 RepID=UPI003BF5685F